MLAASLTVVLWSVHFTLIYGFTALACARGMAGAVPWAVGLASAAALIALAAIAVPAGVRAVRTAEFSQFMTVGLGALAAIAIVWEASSVLWVRACG